MESGWKAVDVTPGYYYNVATLQKMVNTPKQIKKNAALKNNGYKGKQTAGSGKSDRDLTDKMKDAAKNTAMILLGFVGCGNSARNCRLYFVRDLRNPFMALRTDS